MFKCLELISTFVSIVWLLLSKKSEKHVSTYCLCNQIQSYVRMIMQFAVQYGSPKFTLTITTLTYF